MPFRAIVKIFKLISFYSNDERIKTYKFSNEATWNQIERYIYFSSYSSKTSRKILIRLIRSIGKHTEIPYFCLMIYLNERI